MKCVFFCINHVLVHLKCVLDSALFFSDMCFLFYKILMCFLGWGVCCVFWIVAGVFFFSVLLWVFWLCCVMFLLMLLSFLYSGVSYNHKYTSSLSSLFSFSVIANNVIKKMCLKYYINYPQYWLFIIVLVLPLGVCECTEFQCGWLCRDSLQLGCCVFAVVLEIILAFWKINTLTMHIPLSFSQQDSVLLTCE